MRTFRQFLEQQQGILGLSPWEFDQGRNGWRALPHSQGIQALRSYLSTHEHDYDAINKPKPLDKQILYWHLGQLLANEGNYREAIQWMQQSFTDNPEWNNYVHTTIAFLQGDAQKVAYYGRSAGDNRGVVERLLQGLQKGQSYKDAY